MKIKCDFCKTEYNLDRVPTTPVRCAICGRSWVVASPNRKNSVLIFIASLCALLAAVVFTIAVITQYNAKHRDNRPLIASITTSEVIHDDSGVSHFKVYGTVRNQSAEIYGVPDLLIITYDADGNVLYKQKFEPSATLIDAGGLVNFTHVLSAPATGVKKISAELVGVNQ